MDEPISEDELAEWSHDIDLFMEGLNNPDRLEALLEQSKAKKLWDNSQNKSPTQLDRHLSKSHHEEDSISIEDYMNRWCNAIQTPNSPTPQEDHRMPQLFPPEERDTLNKYNKFINEFSVRIEGGWSLADTLPYDENLLPYTLGLSLRHNPNTESHPDSVQDIKRNRLTLQPDSKRKTESDKESTSIATTKLEPQSSEEGQQFSEDEELPF